MAREQEHAEARPTISRHRVACAAVVGWALIALPSAPPPGTAVVAEPIRVAAPTRTGADEPSIARVLTHMNAHLSQPERDRIARAVIRYSAKYELDPELVTAVMLVESRGLPGARSPKGAMGLMQVMPAMLTPLGMAGNYTTVESNIEAGCLILADNIRRMGEADGILAYFWGPRIRGSAYLERVRAAQAEVRRILRSS
jgi:soluble lytic murein transglycosylase-like protein